MPGLSGRPRRRSGRRRHPRRRDRPGPQRYLSRPKHAAAVRFGLQVHTSPATVTDATLDDLRRYGFTERKIADVVGIVALNVLTGTFNLIAGITPDTEGQ